MKKGIRVFIFITTGLVILFYLAVTVSLPIKKITELNQIATNDSVFMKKNSAIAKHPKLLPLVKEKAFKEAMITMAKQDSIGLVINFKDSTASLMLNGVEIYSSKIIRYKKDQIFDGIKAPAFRKIFSEPLHNYNEFSSVIKEPIVVKKAPKDTIEAMKMATLPDTIVPEPAYVSYTLEHGINLIMVQDKWISAEDRKTERKFLADLRKQRIRDNFSGLFNYSKSTYAPTIIIEMSGREVRSIYRALPYRASFVLLL